MEEPPRHQITNSQENAVKGENKLLAGHGGFTCQNWQKMVRTVVERADLVVGRVWSYVVVHQVEIDEKMGKEERKGG